MVKRLLYIFTFILLTKMVSAQCPQIYDYLGNLVNKPYFISCTGTSSYNMNFASNASWGAYTIDWGDGTANTTGGSYVANALINHTYNSATPDTFVITLTIPSLGCTLTGIAVMEKPVNASIQIPIGGITTACAPKMLAFTNASTDVSESTVFTWSFGDGTPIQTYNYTNAGQTVTHTYNPNTVNCQTMVTLTAKNYCTTAPTTSNFNPIQIYDIDDANITPSALVKCWPDNTFTYNNTTNRNCVTQGNTFQRQERWNLGDHWGLGHDSIVGWRPWPPTSPLSVTYPSIGNYSVQLEDSNLCGIDIQVLSVSIVNPPTAGLVGPSVPFCQGAPVTFTNTSSTGYAYKWDFGAGGGFVTRPFGPQTFIYNTPGTYTVSVVALIVGSSAACTDTDRVVVTILPSPVANFSLTPTKGCDFITGAVFTDLSTGAIVQWNWNFGNGNTFSGQFPPPQNYTTVGNFVTTLSIASANNCISTHTAAINVYQKPIASFSTTPTCVLALASFSDTSTHAVGDPINTWNWNFGDASATATSTLQNSSHTYSVQNTYTVQLIVNTANCGDTAIQVITINLKPTANFTLTPISGCPTLSVNFTNLSVNATSYSWNFGTGATSTSTNPIASFTNALTTNKTYTVSLTAQTGLGCTDTKTATVLVFPKPTASFTLNATAGCSPIVTTFTNTSIGGNTYLWDYGDGSTSSTSSAVITHTYTNNTLLIQTYTAQLVTTSANGCKDSATLSLTIYPRPVFNFTMAPAFGCSPLTVNFSPVPGVVSYLWDFGDGSTTTTFPNPAHTFTNTTNSNQTFTVQLIASNAFSCIDTAYGFPIVYPKPIPGFVHTPTVGCSPLPVTFTNTSVLATSYLWYLGDSNTSTATDPVHTYTNASSTANQTYNATLVAITNDGCRDSISKPILLLYKPKASFTVDTPSCSPKTLTFINTSSGATSYFWNLGSSVSTNTDVTKQFINSGSVSITQTVQLIAASVNNCTDTLIVPIFVHPKPEYTIIATPDTGCTALTVNFPLIPGVDLYQWNFGDGNASLDPNPTNVYTNNTLSSKTYTVQLIGTSVFGCRDTSTKIITVYAKPIALFQANPNVVYVPNMPVVCSNLSSGAISYYWDFGDGGSSTMINPIHNYQVAGEYQIYLVATNAHGCLDTFQLPSKITGVLESNVDVPNAFSPNPNGGNGGGYGSNDTNNDVFHPVIRGADKYELNIFSRWGELLFVSKDVNIGWDGYYKGKLCTQDVYIWKIIATTIDGKKIDKTGDILLLR